MDQVFEVKRRVEFSETDMAGIVHFSNFFKWMEIAEQEFHRSRGIPSMAKEGGIWHGWPKRKCSCDFKTPLRFQEEFSVQVEIEEVRIRSVSYKFTFRKVEDGSLIARGEMVSAWVRFNPEKGEIESVPFPDELAVRLGTS